MQIPSDNSKLLNYYFWPFLMFALGMLMAINQSVGFDLTIMPGSLGDGRFNNYILEHGYQYFTTKGMPYWNAPFFFPEKDVISYSDNLFGALPIYIFFRSIFDRETAYQLWYLLLIAFNFIGAYYALRKLNVSAFAASIGAFIYAFSLIISIQTAHAQLLPRFMAPLAIVSFYLWLQRKGNKHVYISLLLLTYQFYCAVYLGYFLLYVLIVMFVLFLIKEKKFDIIIQLFKLKRDRIQTLIYLGITFTLLGVLFYPYFLRSIDGGGYPHMEIIRHYTPKLWTYFFAAKNSVTWGWTNQFFVNTFISDTSPRGEGYIFTGIFPYVFFIASFFMYRNDTKIHFFLFAAAILFVVFLSVFDFSIYSYVVYFIPGARAIRVVSRYLVVAIFLWSIISALFLDRFLISSTIYTTLLICIIPVLLIFDNMYVARKKGEMKVDIQKRSMMIVEEYESKKQVNSTAKAFVLIFNTDAARNNLEKNIAAVSYHMDAMMASQIIGLPCVNGYSAKVPPEYDSCFYSPDETNVNAWLHSNRIQTALKEKYTINDILILKESH